MSLGKDPEKETIQMSPLLVAGVRGLKLLTNSVHAASPATLGHPFLASPHFGSFFVHVSPTEQRRRAGRMPAHFSSTAFSVGIKLLHPHSFRQV